MYLFLHSMYFSSATVAIRCDSVATRAVTNFLACSLLYCYVRMIPEPSYLRELQATEAATKHALASDLSVVGLSVAWTLETLGWNVRFDDMELKQGKNDRFHVVLSFELRRPSTA